MKLAQSFVQKSRILLVLSLTVVSMLGAKALAYGGNSSTPVCLDEHNHPMAVDNGTVLHLKLSTPNSYHARALIQGNVTKLYSDHSGHHHFQLKIGQGPTDTIEVVYNEEFGGFPQFGMGSTVIACGDYITSNRQTNYPMSPDGAIIHWVHLSNEPQRHPSGFLVINGTLTGQGNGRGQNRN